MYGYVYLTTNTINGRKYIGRCKSSFFRGANYLGSGLALNNAIQKYGADKFIVEMIDTAESDEELNTKEEYYIDYYDAVKSDEYYNLRRGGSRGPGGPMFKGHKHTSETRKLMSELKKGELNNNYGNRWTASPELKALHSKLSSGENNGMYGKHHSEESKMKNRLSNLGHKWMNDGTTQGTFKGKQIQEQLDMGWVFGMLPRKTNK